MSSPDEEEQIQNSDSSQDASAVPARQVAHPVHRSRPRVPAAHEKALVLALMVSLLSWNLPEGGYAFYPFKLLATWLHEMSHGVIMLLSGAGFSRLEIYQDTSGIAYAESSVGTFARSIIASAGYMGTSTLGAVLMVISQTPKRARVALFIMGVCLGLSAALWVRNDFGLKAVLCGGIVLLMLAALLREAAATYFLSLIAAQACINAVLDIRILFRPELVINGERVGASDAHTMAEASFGTPRLWAWVWLLWSFVALFLALWFLRKTNRRRRMEELEKGRFQAEADVPEAKAQTTLDERAPRRS